MIMADLYIPGDSLKVEIGSTYYNNYVDNDMRFHPILNSSVASETLHQDSVPLYHSMGPGVLQLGTLTLGSRTNRQPGSTGNQSITCVYEVSTTQKFGVRGKITLIISTHYRNNHIVAMYL